MHTLYDGEENLIHRRGLMLVMSSPVGGGKTTIARKLMEYDANLVLSVSCTSRPPRPKEIDGEHYHFLSRQEFEAQIKADQFYEYAEFVGNYYGTPKAPAIEAMQEGRDIILTLEWQGVQQLQQQAADDVVSIFILPPSWSELEQRLRKRAQDSEETIRKRLAFAKVELTHFDNYQYVVVNDNLDDCVATIQSILAAERVRRHRLDGAASFVADLLKQSGQ